MLDVMSGGRLRVRVPARHGHGVLGQRGEPRDRASALPRVARDHPQVLDRGRTAELRRRLLQLPVPEPVAEARCKSRTRSATSSAPAHRRRSSSRPSSASATRSCSSRPRCSCGSSTSTASGSSAHGHAVTARQGHDRHLRLRRRERASSRERGVHAAPHVLLRGRPAHDAALPRPAWLRDRARVPQARAGTRRARLGELGRPRRHQPHRRGHGRAGRRCGRPLDRGRGHEPREPQPRRSATCRAGRS